MDVNSIGIVKQIVLAKSEKKTWTELKADYQGLKEKITQEYGEPVMNLHSFASPYYEGDGKEMIAVRLEKTAFLSSWLIENGSIVLTIDYTRRIFICFLDSANNDIDEK